MSTSATRPPQRPKSRPLVRVVTSAILVSLFIYAVWLRGPFRSSSKIGKPASTQPLKTLSPSSEAETAFAWVPHYPGAVTEDITNSVNHDRVSYGFHFRVPSQKDAAPVLTYYETQLRAAGFRDVAKRDSSLHAESLDGKRILELTVATGSAGTQASLAAVEK